MSRSYNHVTLVGNLTRDPEVRATASGDEFCRFSLAVNWSYKNRDGDAVEGVDFVDISVWGGLTSIVQNYCHKGKQVLVSGRLKSSSWEQDGQKRSKLEVRADNIILLGSNASQADSQDSDSSTKPNKAKKSNASKTDNNASEDFEVDGDYDYSDQVDLDDVPF